MHIDIIIATHNRARQLRRALGSLLESRAAEDFSFSIVVVDNGSTDETAAVARECAARAPDVVRYLREPKPGKSRAVNRGIAATSGDVIAIADDDQVMAPDWLNAIRGSLVPGVDYVTGPVFGEWDAPAPRWYDDRLRGVLSLYDGGDAPFSQEPDDASEIFSAGNAAFTRAAVERVGGLHPSLGKLAGTFSMCEDGELLLRLKRAGFRGVYEPRMAVRHRVPAERLTRRYFRRWHWGYGVSMALIDTLHPRPVAYWLGIPRFLVRAAIEAFPRMTLALARGDRPGAFREELRLWFTLGFISGKLRPASFGEEKNGRDGKNGSNGAREGAAPSSLHRE